MPPRLQDSKAHKERISDFKFLAFLSALVPWWQEY